MAVLQAPSSPDHTGERRTILNVCLLLGFVVFLVFGRTLGCGFVFDDRVYVTQNAIVQAGLTWRGFLWALTYSKIGHWHPLTWLSHMLDCQFYGLNATGHHFTNVLLHAAATILLFLVLQRMTGALWRSAFVAAVFAVHPLHVESVAWVAERKDVLSGFFFMLTLGAYLRYVRQPSKARYGVVVLCFALGLLSKDMLVTLPFVLLLLDYWPLNRLQSPKFEIRNVVRLVVEKIPLFVLTAGSCVIALLSAEKVYAYGRLPLGLRLENAVVSYITYIGQMIYPSKLSCLYPNPTVYFPFWQIAAALALLLAISVAVWVFRKQSPWLLVGWLWYLGMLVPVIGLVQIGYQSHADRYTYLPQIGLYLAITWGVGEFALSWRYRRQLLATMALAIIVVLSICSWKQIAYWQNDESLWKRAIACTSGNYIAHNNLGVDLAWGSASPSQNQITEAIRHFQKAVAINPRFPEAHFNLGMLFGARGRTSAAIEQYKTGLAFEPDNPKVHHLLADLYFGQGQWKDAIENYQQALKRVPDFVPDRYHLGLALEREGQPAAAAAQFQKVIELDPAQAKALNDLAWILATCPDSSVRNGQMAVELAQRAVALSPNNSPKVLDTLAAAYAEAGQFPQAVATVNKALKLATTQKNQSLVDGLRTRLKLYEANLPYHKP